MSEDRNKTVGWVTQKLNELDAAVEGLTAAKADTQYWREQHDVVQRELTELQTEVRCDACLGVPQTDIPCGCGGTGLLADMLTTTRQELAVARAELVELRRWNTKMLEDRNRALDELRALKKAFAELRQQR